MLFIKAAIVVVGNFMLITLTEIIITGNFIISLKRVKYKVIMIVTLVTQQKQITIIGVGERHPVPRKVVTGR